MRIIIVRGEGIRWFQRYLGQDDTGAHQAPHGPLGIRRAGSWASISATGPAAPRPSSSPPWAAPWAATSAPHPPSSAARASSSISTRPGTNSFTVMCEMEKKLRVQSFFTLDENFLLHKKRALRLLELMEANGKSWAIYRLQLGPGPAVLHHGSAGGTGGRLGLDGTGRGGERLRQAEGGRYPGPGAGAPGPRHPRPGLIHHRPRRPPAGKHGRRSSIMPSATTRSSTSSCSTRPLPGHPLYEKHRQEGTLLPEDGISLCRRPRAVPLQLPPSPHQGREEEKYLLEALPAGFRGSTAPACCA